MTDDPLCLEYAARVPYPICACDPIRKARADERERIAQAIEAMDRIEDPDDLIFDAARIARGDQK